MALQKATTFKGVEASYWKITGASASYMTGKTNVLLSLYLDSEARNADENNVLSAQAVIVPGVDLSRAQLYGMVKELPAFVNASDC